MRRECIHIANVPTTLLTHDASNPRNRPIEAKKEETKEEVKVEVKEEQSRSLVAEAPASTNREYPPWKRNGGAASAVDAVGDRSTDSGDLPERAKDAR